MRSAKTNVSFVRSEFLSGLGKQGWLTQADHAELPIDDSFSLVVRLDAQSRTGLVLAGCELGLLSHRHQLVGHLITDHLEGVTANRSWRRFWFPYFTSAWLVTLHRGCRDSQDISGYELHWRQACWYYSDEPSIATTQIATLVDFVAGNGSQELKAFASDQTFIGFFNHDPTARGPSDIAEAICCFQNGDVELGRRILRGQVPGKRRFVSEIYPGILDRLEALHSSGELSAILTGRSK